MFISTMFENLNELNTYNLLSWELGFLCNLFFSSLFNFSVGVKIIRNTIPRPYLEILFWLWWHYSWPPHIPLVMLRHCLLRQIIFFFLHLHTYKEGNFHSICGLLSLLTWICRDFSIFTVILMTFFCIKFRWILCLSAESYCLQYFE